MALKNEWTDDIKIAKDLGYPKTVIMAMKMEPSSRRRQVILTNARHGIFPTMKGVLK